VGSDSWVNIASVSALKSFPSMMTSAVIVLSLASVVSMARTVWPGVKRSYLVVLTARIGRKT
ncbi:hypothetical protein, partial [Aeromonas hydrophila]|uniref:hypothetical protein n=1 Tax=Aeromonas hydrophila TaxID=644 RepID=UPI003F6807C3